jgi:hypothetical protein
MIKIARIFHIGIERGFSYFFFGGGTKKIVKKFLSKKIKNFCEAVRVRELQTIITDKD